MTNICGEKRARGWVASTLPVCAPMTARCVVYIDGGGGKRALERRKQPPRIIVTKHTLCSIFSSLTRLEGAWRGGKSERDPPSDLSTPSPPPSPSFRREFVRFFFSLRNKGKYFEYYYRVLRMETLNFCEWYLQNIHGDYREGFERGGGRARVAGMEKIGAIFNKSAQTLSARIFKIANLTSSFTFIMGRGVIARQHGDVINATRKTFITLLN